MLCTTLQQDYTTFVPQKTLVGFSIIFCVSEFIKAYSSRDCSQDFLHQGTESDVLSHLTRHFLQL